MPGRQCVVFLLSATQLLVSALAYDPQHLRLHARELAQSLDDHPPCKTYGSLYEQAHVSQNEESSDDWPPLQKSSTRDSHTSKMRGQLPDLDLIKRQFGSSTSSSPLFIPGISTPNPFSPLDSTTGSTTMTSGTTSTSSSSTTSTTFPISLPPTTTSTEMTTSSPITTSTTSTPTTTSSSTTSSTSTTSSSSTSSSTSSTSSTSTTTTSTTTPSSPTSTFPTSQSIVIVTTTIHPSAKPVETVIVQTSIKIKNQSTQIIKTSYVVPPVTQQQTKAATTAGLQTGAADRLAGDPRLGFVAVMVGVMGIASFL